MTISPKPKNEFSLWLLAFAIGLPAAWAAYHHFYLSPWSASVSRYPLVWFLAAALALCAAFGWLLRGAWPRLMAHGRLGRGLWVLGALLAGAAIIVVIPLVAPPPPAGAWGWAQTTTIYLGDILGLGLLVLGLSLWLVHRPPAVAAPVRVGRWYWLRFALPCAAVWSAYLLAFWPGIMTADSLDQWGQLLAGRFADIHPPLHTMTMWLITRLWLSPAAVALVQIVVLSALIGLGLALLRAYGVPAWALWVACLLSAGSLVNSLMVITLWKDILFSTAVLALTLLIVALIHSGPRLLHQTGYLIALALAATLAAFFRQNGPLVGFGTLAVLVLAYPRFWLRLGISLACIIGVWIVVRGPVYDALGVVKTPAWYQLQPIIGHVASYVQAGALEAGNPLTPNEVRLLNTFRPLADHWQDYDCYDPFGFIVTPPADVNALNSQVGNMILIDLRLIGHNPGFMVRESLRCNSLVWQISQPTGYPEYFTGIKLDSSGRLLSITPVPNASALGLVPHSILPELEAWLAGLYFPTLAANWVWLFWRPALYTYLLSASVLLVTIRLKNWRYLLIGVPVWLTTVPFLLLPISPDFRFHYAAYLVGLLLFIPIQLLPGPAGDDR